jgi:hypothetical protein
VLQGWVDWADGSTFLAATQAHRDLVFPYLQVKDAQGNWKTVIEDMGIPSGKPKTMAVDLTGKFLSASREVRIVTNLCVYWDEIYLFENNAARARLTEIPMTSADLHFRGFSRATIDPERKQPEAFDYQAVQLYFHVEPHARKLHALRRGAGLVAGARRSHGDPGLGRRDPHALPAPGCPRCRPAGNATTCCWWMAGPRTRTPIRHSRSRCCLCLSTR